MFNSNAHSKPYLIIPASGLGKRSLQKIPKQFIKIQGKTILEHTLDAFSPQQQFRSIIITLPEDFTSSHLAKKLNSLGYCIIPGGKERQNSIWAALQYVQKTATDNDIILIHDAVRPFITKTMINNLIETCKIKDAVIPALPITETIKKCENNSIQKTISRDKLFIAQTPQAFKFKLIFKAYKKALQENKLATDDSSLLEQIGISPTIITGNRKNIKITTPEDIEMTKHELASTKCGMGYDAHQLVKNRKLILCGISIPFEKGLMGHSDADVATHAIIDSLLGALALGDIGEHFPDTKSEYKNISSIDLLKTIHEKFIYQKASIEHIDLTIIAEKPKISPYKDEMKNLISNVLKIDKNRLNIKATTTEGMGFEGEEKGISAKAISTIKVFNEL